jgi:hypothetical protein
MSFTSILLALGALPVLALLYWILVNVEWWYQLLTDRELRESSPRNLRRLANAARRAASKPMAANSWDFTARDFSNIALSILAKRGVDLAKLPKEQALRELATMESKVADWLMGQGEKRQRYEAVIKRANDDKQSESSYRRRVAERVLDMPYDQIAAERREVFEEVHLSLVTEDLKANPPKGGEAPPLASFLRDQDDLAKVLSDCANAEQFTRETELTIEKLYRTAIKARGGILAIALGRIDKLMELYAYSATFNSKGEDDRFCTTQAFKHPALGLAAAEFQLSLSQTLILAKAIGQNLEEFGMGEVEIQFSNLMAARKSEIAVAEAEEGFRSSRRAAERRYESLRSLWALLNASFDDFFKAPVRNFKPKFQADSQQASLRFESNSSGQWKDIRVEKRKGKLHVHDENRPN